MKGRRNELQGFTITEMAVVLVIIGLLFVFLLPMSSTLKSNQSRAATLQQLQKIQAALNNFVIINHRLPCPADGSLVPPTGFEAINVSGAAVGDCMNNQALGIVPWVALALTPADALDAWNNQITYRVGYGLTRPSAIPSPVPMVGPFVLDMSNCDPGGSGPAVSAYIPIPPGGNATPVQLCNSTTYTDGFNPANYTSPSNFLTNKGLDVTTDGTTKLMDHTGTTGAAYILISHGDDNYGAINSAGVYVASPVRGVSGIPTLEINNANTATNIVISTTWNQFVDAPFSDANNPATYFDDIIIHPSLLSVLNQANLGPRSH